MNNDDELVKKDYRIHLDWSSLVWVLKENMILEKDGQFFNVLSVNKPLVPGDLPTVTIKEIISSD